ncbi:transporter associated domain-containing protein [Pseudomonas sp. ML96]|uniref:transporter associated domain-containing protein n=1 Tax=Pseudomonas sp. ML96 TaxID=1523503 RepID=UPI00068D7DDD
MNLAPFEWWLGAAILLAGALLLLRERNLLPSSMRRTSRQDRAAGAPRIERRRTPRNGTPQEGRLQRQHALLQLLELERVTVDDIMIPRSEIVGIDLDDELPQLIEQLRGVSHTRLPVYRGDINQIEGITHMRRLAALLTQNRLSHATLQESCIAPYFVPKGTPLGTQLMNFQKEKRRLGLVVDEYGDVQGVVTLEDLLDEIIGDFSHIEGEENPDIHTQEDGSRIIDGTASIREINKALGWHLPSEGPKTLNGLVTEALESIPDSPVCLKIGPYRLEILEASENRVLRVRAWH